MLRAILAVIVSYVLMFILIFLAFTCVYFILGAAGSFKPGSFAASNTWIAIAFVVNFVVAVIGGLKSCPLLDWKFTALGHNTVRGAAGASVLNAEAAAAEGLLD